MLPYLPSACNMYALRLIIIIHGLQNPNLSLYKSLERSKRFIHAEVCVTLLINLYLTDSREPRNNAYPFGKKGIYS